MFCLGLQVLGVPLTLQLPGLLDGQPVQLIGGEAELIVEELEDGHISPAIVDIGDDFGHVAKLLGENNADVEDGTGVTAVDAGGFDLLDRLVSGILPGVHRDRIDVQIGPLGLLGREVHLGGQDVAHLEQLVDGPALGGDDADIALDAVVGDGGAENQGLVDLGVDEGDVALLPVETDAQDLAVQGRVKFILGGIEGSRKRVECHDEFLLCINLIDVRVITSYVQ